MLNQPPSHKESSLGRKSTKSTKSAKPAKPVKSDKSVKPAWFSQWFGTAYYNLLYKDRDEAEARRFIDRLYAILGMRPGESVLDWACGQGRHALHLHRKGLEVLGLDLSAKAIAKAKQHQTPALRFHVHDMRKVFARDSFDYVLNMFTSFGYFDTDTEHSAAMSAAATALRKGGKLLIDFLNPVKLRQNLVPEEKKVVEGVVFHITRRIVQGHVHKRIRIVDGQRRLRVEERVRLITQEAFWNYFAKAGLRPLRAYGSYALELYVPAESERLILLAEK